MLIRVKRKLRHPDAPQRHDNHRRPMTRRELIGAGLLTGGATVLSTGLVQLCSRIRAHAFAQLADTILQADANLLGCGVDRSRHENSVHLLRPRGRREPRGLERARRQAERSARHAHRRPATASSACRATKSRASRKYVRDGHEQRRPHRHEPGARVPQRQRVPARHVRELQDARYRREHQRRRDPGPLRERHRQQSAQPAVRHPTCRRGGLDPHADRLAEHRLGRQLDGAGDDDQRRVPADEGRPAERRDGPRRHERTAEAAERTKTRSP